MKLITLMQKTVLTIIIILVVIQSAFSQFTSKKPQSTKKKPIPQIQKQEQGSDFKVDSTSYITNEEVSRMLDLRLKNFAECLELLVNKKVNKQEVIDKYAMRLFANNENVWVQVKNRRDDTPKSYPIRLYLNRIATLKYDYITVQYAHFSYKSPLHRGKDSIIRGTYTALQHFYGWNKEGQVYDDLIKKHITFRVVVDNEAGMRTGASHRRFNLYLEDIVVSEREKKSDR